MKSTHHCCYTVLALVISTVPTALLAADESALESSAERCINLSRIDRTEVLDDQNIVFFTKNQRAYVNKLPHSCAGLKRADSYMYKTSINQLCDLDIITVLENAGFGFMRGPSCGLGSFYPVDSERAKQMVEQSGG